MSLSTSQLSSNLISQTIAKLRLCSQVNIQSNWRCYFGDLSTIQSTKIDWLQQEAAQLNAKEHIAWSAGQQVLWLGQKLIIPDNLAGYPTLGLCLRLGLTWWAESAQIYINGECVQEGDLFDCAARVVLCADVKPQAEITITVRLVSPGHDCGALVRSHLVYESTDDQYPEPGFIADEFAILEHYLATFNPKEILTLATAIAAIDWGALPDQHKFTRSLLEVRNSVQYLAQPLKQRCIYNLSHAHLDLAWLWDISETWDAAVRTFESVLELQQEFLYLTFCHSSPAVYAWIEKHRPELFTAIQQQVATKRWEVVGGLWVEPELNTVNGESIVRQLLYGQHYVLAKFGEISTVAWLPDSFGFCATLPQILQQAGIEYFVTQKLLWNDTTKFPYGAFWWRSPDGTTLLSLMSAPIGEGIDPVKMVTYACDWEKQTHLQASLWLPGVGDHGGGPSRDMLEILKRWQKSAFFPRVEFTTAAQYLQRIREHSATNNISLAPETKIIPSVDNQLPVWDDELYLEFHRGCYTTHADQKRWNRRCEDLLYAAELFASLATISVGEAYPQAQLETAWKQLLFNHFHDILPGSSIPEVYAEVNCYWQQVEQVAQNILQQSQAAIASRINLPAPVHPQAVPIVIFNALNWQRSQVVSVPLPTSAHPWTIYNLEAQSLPCQRVDSSLLFLATDIPAVGYRVFWLSPAAIDTDLANYINIIPDNAYVLENELLRVIVDQKTGDLASIFDKTHAREILRSHGNQLQAFEDSGQYWDAWNIDPNYAEHPLPPTELKSIEWLERGAIQTRLRVVRQLGASEFCQDYVLQADSPLLKIVTTVNWQERHVIVKAAFPVNVAADFATYEIPCGAIARPTEVNQSKWEVPALRWADLSSAEYGVSLLNDCKYGYDAQAQQLRLTLLRSSTWPDAEADRGVHEFTYAIYPHSGNWQHAHTVRHGYELNLPLQVMLVNASNTSQHLPAVGRLLDLQAENLVLMAFKQSETNPQEWILRCYEAHGAPAELCLHSDLGLKFTHSVDLLEQPTPTPAQISASDYAIAPWKIVSVAVSKS